MKSLFSTRLPSLVSQPIPLSTTPSTNSRVFACSRAAARGGSVHGRKGLDAALRDAGCLGVHDAEWASSAQAEEAASAVAAAAATSPRSAPPLAPRDATPSTATPMAELVGSLRPDHPPPIPTPPFPSSVHITPLTCHFALSLSLEKKKKKPGTDIYKLQQ